MGFLLTFLLVYLLHFLQLAISSVLEKQVGMLSPDKFGPVECHVSHIEICKGPKSTSCSVVTSENPGEDFANVTFTLDFKRNVQFTKTKIALWTNQSLPSPDIVKWIDLPCTHFFLGPLLDKIFRPNANCMVKKGVYVARLNLSALMSELVGVSFFYGHYKSQSIVLSKDCNIACVRTKFSLRPKETMNTTDASPKSWK